MTNPNKLYDTTPCLDRCMANMGTMAAMTLEGDTGE